MELYWYCYSDKLLRDEFIDTIDVSLFVNLDTDLYVCIIHYFFSKDINMYTFKILLQLDKI